MNHPCLRIRDALNLLGESTRLRILCGLALECRPVSDIVAQTGLSQTNVSFHLRKLREAGFLRAERRGPFVYYCLADAELMQILENLKLWLETHAVCGPGAHPKADGQKRSKPKNKIITASLSGRSQATKR